MSLTEKQKAAREQALGSSDAPVVAGVSPYKSPLELYYQLHGELPRYTDEETEAMAWGSRLEPVIAKVASEQLGIKTRRIGVRYSTRHPGLLAHLDYEIVNNPKGPGVLEVKNRMGRAFDELPDDISIQVAHQLAVTERDWAIVAVLFGFGKLKTFEVQRDKELEEYLVELEARFLVRVQKGEPPDHTWTPETVGILKKLYPLDSGKTIELPAICQDFATQFLLAKQEIEAGEQHKAIAEGKLKEVMQDATYGTVAGYTISWKSTKPSTRFDLDRFEREHPGVYEQYFETVSGYRRFLVKPKKELKHERSRRPHPV